MDDFRFEDVASGAPDDVYARTLDRRETSAAVEVYYRVFSRSYLFATAGWTRYDFAFAESAWRDGEAVKAAGGFRFPLTGRARGRVLFGWKSFRPDASGRRPFSGLIAAYRGLSAPGRFAATVGYDRDNAFSYNESAYYYVDERAGAVLSLYLAPFLRIDGGVQYGDHDLSRAADGLAPAASPSRSTAARTSSGPASVGPVLRIGGTVGLGLTYNLYRRTSNVPGFDVRRNFAGSVPDLRILTPCPGRKGRPEENKTAVLLALRGRPALASRRSRGAGRSSAEYKIGPKDLLEITVLGVRRSASLVVRVSEDGRITLPLLGEVDVGDLTKFEVEKQADPARRREDRAQAPGHRATSSNT